MYLSRKQRAVNATAIPGGEVNDSRVVVFVLQQYKHTELGTVMGVFLKSGVLISNDRYRVLVKTKIG